MAGPAIAMLRIWCASSLNGRPGWFYRNVSRILTAWAIRTATGRYAECELQKRFLANVAGMLAVRNDAAEREALIVEAERLVEPLLGLPAGSVRERFSTRGGE